jgi:hypothetical protein
MVKANRTKLDDWRLIHAVCVFEGERYAHAWCERDGEFVMSRYVIDGKPEYVETDRKSHYEIFKVEMVRSYTVRQATDLNFYTGHYGPWDQDIRRYCNSGKRVFGATKIEVTS